MMIDIAVQAAGEAALREMAVVARSLSLWVDGEGWNVGRSLNESARP